MQQSTNMDVLVAMGSSVAHGYSTVLPFFPELGNHTHFETSAVIIVKKGSEHPVGKTIVESAYTMKIQPLRADNIMAVSGMRAMAGVEDRMVRAGKPSWFKGLGMDMGVLEKELKKTDLKR